MKSNVLLPILLAAITAACGLADDPHGVETSSDSPNSARPIYVVMDDDLQQLKDDFNANHGSVRLVFVSGPTCGICLRGMADLNDEFIAASQDDERLVTFVVHVPTMGAKEHHAADSIPLLNGPRIHHYWEETGIIGQLYAEVMDVDFYVWDFWAIYGPEAAWEGLLPPVPDYYEHQLGVTTGRFRGFPKERVLDAERFAAETGKYLGRIENKRFAAKEDVEAAEDQRLIDAILIPHVGQPRSVAVRQHIMGRGGYKNLKRIQSIEARGQIEANGQTFDLTVRSERPNSLRRLISDGENTSVAELDREGIARIDAAADRGLPIALEQKLLNTFEFDGLFVEWPDKGHELSMAGMLKIGDVLAWKLELLQSGGTRWNLFVDSHTGGLVQASLLDAAGQPEYSVRQGDFRETSGFTFPHRIEYMDSTGHSLAVETIDKIELVVHSFELEQESVSH